MLLPRALLREGGALPVMREHVFENDVMVWLHACRVLVPMQPVGGLSAEVLLHDRCC